MSGLESPRPESPVTECPTTPKASDAEFRAENETPPESGTTTPTETMKKGRAGFMNLNPLSGLGFLSLRRYPSSFIGKAAPESDAEGAHVNGDTSAAPLPLPEEYDESSSVEEDDRRTLRGGEAEAAAGEVEGSAEDEVKGGANGDARGTSTELGREKTVDAPLPVAKTAPIPRAPAVAS